MKVAQLRAGARKTAGRPAPWHSERLRRNNPMWNPTTKAKMIRSLKGRPFHARGGNGQTTQPQRSLATALGWAMEYPIGIPGEIRAKLESPPRCYKVDIANPAARQAIEVDGNSHHSTLGRLRDRRKEAVLTALGWCVCRVSNRDAMRLARCLTPGSDPMLYGL